MHKPPKVLMFGWEFPPHNSGGLGVACYGLSKALSNENVHITFVLPQNVGVSPGFLKMVFAHVPRVSLRRVDSLLSPYITSESYKNLRSKAGRSMYGWGLLEEVKRYALEAQKIALEEDFDLIHAHDWLSFLAGIEAKHASGKPLITHVHATEFDRTGGHGVNQDVYNIEREGMHEADRVITVSTFTKNVVTSEYGIPHEKVTVVHNGINQDDYREALEKKDILALKKAGNHIVLFVGRITLQKGPEYFLYAAKRVLEKLPNTYFIIAGSGDMEHKMVRLSAALGIAGKVRFAGFVRGDDLGMLYRSADLYVLPSVSEPFGISPLESLVYGTPVLISRNAGVSEVLPHALKVDFWDIDEMANKIAAVLMNPSLRKQLVKEGQREALAATWKSAAEKCLAIYQSVMNKQAFQ